MKILKEVVGQGPNIVLIHGALANSDDMQLIVHELSKSYTVTNINSPGNGPSKFFESINSIHDEVDYILSELPDEAIYIAWSKGGLTLSSIAARYPTRVKHFIGICTTPKFTATNDWIGVPHPGFKDIIMPLLETTKFVDLMRGMYEPEFINIKPDPQIYHQVMKACDKRLNLPKHIIQKILHLVDTTDFRSEFSKITCPIDIILGTKDAAVPYTAAKQLRELNSNLTIHAIDDAQHIPFVTHPHQFNEILHKILHK